MLSNEVTSGRETILQLIFAQILLYHLDHVTFVLQLHIDYTPSFLSLLLLSLPLSLPFSPLLLLASSCVSELLISPFLHSSSIPCIQVYCPLVLFVICVKLSGQMKYLFEFLHQYLCAGVAILHAQLFLYQGTPWSREQILFFYSIFCPGGNAWPSAPL